MNRWIVFKISKVKEVLPIEMLRYAAVAVVAVLAILLVIVYGKYRKNYQKIVFPMIVVTVILAAFYFVFTLYYSQEVIRSYYLVLPLIGLANVVQLIKTFAAMKLCRSGEPCLPS